jgi:hypothetical protein
MDMLKFSRLVFDSAFKGADWLFMQDGGVRRPGVAAMPGDSPALRQNILADLPAAADAGRKICRLRAVMTKNFRLPATIGH